MTDYQEYLGDGLYAQYEHGMVELYTFDGLRKTNQVFLEEPVLDAFFRWINRVYDDKREEEYTKELAGIIK